MRLSSKVIVVRDAVGNQRDDMIVELALPVILTAPATRIRRGNEVRMVIGAHDGIANRDERLVALVAESRAARDFLLESPFSNMLLPLCNLGARANITPAWSSLQISHPISSRPF